MNPLIILFYTISFSTGLVAILFSMTIYIKYRDRGFLLYALFLISIELLLCRLVLQTFDSFVLATLSKPYLYGHFLQNLSYYFDAIGFILFISNIPVLYHHFLKMPFNKINFSIYVMLGLCSIIFGSFYVMTHEKIFSLILKTVSNGLIVYGIFLILKRRKEIQETFMKKVCRLFLIITLLFLPYFLIDGLLTTVIFAFPTYFLIINILGIFFVSSYIRRPLPGVLPSLKEKYDLTDREFEIVLLLHKGISNTEIADHLSIAKRTVETHVYRIYQKLEIKNRYELIGLIENPMKEINNQTITSNHRPRFIDKIYKKLKGNGNRDSLQVFEHS